MKSTQSAVSMSATPCGRTRIRRDSALYGEMKIQMAGDTEEEADGLFNGNRPSIPSEACHAMLAQSDRSSADRARDGKYEDGDASMTEAEAADETEHAEVHQKYAEADDDD
eukprot:762712-Hanusia_phi.AAC.2